MREKGAQWLVTQGVVHHWRGDKFPQPVSHSESHLVDIFMPKNDIFSNFWPLIFGPKARKKYFGIFRFFLQLNKKICTGPPSPTSADKLRINICESTLTLFQKKKYFFEKKNLAQKSKSQFGHFAPFQTPPKGAVFRLIEVQS